MTNCLKTPALLGLCLAALLTTAPAALAKPHNVRIGIGDQSAAMFDHQGFKDLELRQVRYFIHWDVMEDREKRLHARAWVKAAMKADARPLIHVSTNDFTEKQAERPSKKEYKEQIDRMVKYFRKLGVRDFGAWNEANHKTQPTWDTPEHAAAYWKIMRRAVAKGCSFKSCRVVALDVLDQAGVERYIREFVAAAGRGYVRKYMRIVGVHNYSDVNRKRTTGLRSIVDLVDRYKGDANIWLTETGGLVKFGDNPDGDFFTCDEARAADRLEYLFDTVARYRRHIQRVYLYNWFGGDCDIRFDAGIVNRDGTPRPSFDVVKSEISRFKT